METESFKEMGDRASREYFAKLVSESPTTISRLWDEYQILKKFYESFLDYKEGIKKDLNADGPKPLPILDYIRLKVGTAAIQLNESKRGVDHTVPVRTESYSDALAFFVSKSKGDGS